MTMVEIAVVLTIIAVLSTIFIATLTGGRAGDYIDRATQSIQNDVIFIRSRSVSTNRVHRVRFASTTEWVLEAYITGVAPPNDWEQVGDIRRMPTDTYLTDATWSTSLANGTLMLEATPRGLFQMNGGGPAIPVPYIAITALGSSKNKSITVAVGGAVTIDTNF